MKRKDIALIAVIVVISGIVSLFASKAIFSSPTARKQEVEVVPGITSTFPEPDKQYFNKDAFDPTREITIGESANPNPFNGATAQ